MFGVIDEIRTRIFLVHSQGLSAFAPLSYNHHRITAFGVGDGSRTRISQIESLVA